MKVKKSLLQKNQLLQVNLSDIYSYSDTAEIITQPINYMQSLLVRNQTIIAYCLNQYIYGFQPKLDFVGTVSVEIKSTFYYSHGPVDQIIYTKYEIIIEP